VTDTRPLCQADWPQRCHHWKTMADRVPWLQASNPGTLAWHGSGTRANVYFKWQHALSVQCRISNRPNL